MKNILKNSMVFALLLFSSLHLFSQKTSVESVYHYTLENGLELFIAENSNVPLTYIELAVKGGGISQTEETVGLFHLYEHMIFKGNTKFPTAAAVQKAINDMGVPSWNGSTGSEYVNYFFTVPSDLTYDGLEFWSYAVREPLLDEKEFENEKKVVVAELEGGFSDPNRILYSALYKNAFPETPWQFDPGGTVERVQNASLDALIDMKNTYYIPNNTALFVGGDVNHREVYTMVKDIYGDWKRGEDPWENKDYLVDNTPFEEQVYFVHPNEQISPSIAQITVSYRGPDAELDKESTYTADVFLTTAQDPGAPLINTITDIEELGIPTYDYFAVGFTTQRHGSFIRFNTAMVSPEENLVDRVMLLSHTIQNDIVQNIVSDSNYFSKEQYENAKRRMRDSQLFETQTAQGLLSTIRFFWTATDSEYYFTYLDNLDDVSAQDVSTLLDEYILGKNSFISVSINPKVYETQKADFENAGFITITDENAFWWKVGY